MSDHEASSGPQPSAIDQLSAALREQRGPDLLDMTWQQRRRNMEMMQLGLPELPDDVETEPAEVAGVPVEWITAGETPVVRTEGTMVYLHGGGYTIGSINTHRHLMARIAREAGCPVLAVDYRLAPEHPCPAAIDDVRTVLSWLADEQQVAPGRTVLAGDSAGGGLTLSTLLELRDAEAALPAAGVLLSPWTDLTLRLPAIEQRAELDPMVTRDGLELMAGAYAGGLDRTDPRVSPLRARDLDDLPPLLIQVGTAEILFDDAAHLARRIQDSGGTALLEKWDRMIHVFQAFPQLDEAHQAVRRIGQFVRGALNTAS